MTEEKNSPQIRADVEALCGFGGRGAGSDAEKKAAEWMADELRAAGCDVTMQSFRSPISYASMVFMVLLLSLGGALLLRFGAVVGSLGLLSAALVLFLGEFTGWLRLLRRLVPGRESVNVIGWRKVESPRRTFLISGHLDTAHEGLIFHPTLLRWTGGGPPLSPWTVVILAMLGLWAVALCGVLKITSGFLVWVWWASVVILAISMLLMIEWQFGARVPGANDNASGVAAALVMARWAQQEAFEDCDFFFLGFGAEEPYLHGSTAYASAFGRSFDPKTTHFMNLDGIASGKLYYVTSENMVLPLSYTKGPAMDALLALIQEDERFSDLQPVVIRGGTDAMPLLQAGLQGITLVCLEDNHIPLHYHRREDSPERMKWEDSDRAIALLQAMVHRLSK